MRKSVQETKDETKEIKKEKFTIAQKVATIKDSLLMRKQITKNDSCSRLHSSSQAQYINILNSFSQHQLLHKQVILQSGR